MLHIEWDYGAEHGDDMDLRRAYAAAVEAFAAGSTIQEAERVANLALTKDWADPEGAACSLYESWE